MDGFTIFLFVLSISARLAASHQSVYDVLNFGAVGDGKTDDTKSFLKAWGSACKDPSDSTLIVPGNKIFLLGEVKFTGPCKATTNVKVVGTIVAPNKVYKLSSNSGSKWITFYSVENLIIDGGGTFDGQGSSWWECKANKRCSEVEVPDGLALMHCNNLRMQSITVKNAPKMQVTVYACIGVFITDLHITSPGDSSNTDGLHIQHCKQMTVEDSIIGSGDDCISIGTGTSKLNITRIRCGPGHGISIGSLGQNKEAEMVTDVNVQHCTFFDTMCAARIKTWSGGEGLAQRISFEHLNVSAVEHPIVINQYYCPDHVCKKKRDAVRVDDIKFIDIQGTTTGEDGIKLLCNDAVGCTNIQMHYINIISTRGKVLKPVCKNVNGHVLPPVSPEVPCVG